MQQVTDSPLGNRRGYYSDTREYPSDQVLGPFELILGVEKADKIR